MKFSDNSKITIDHVAQYCGVSKSTISRYLNGRYDAMSAETKNRIRDAIDALHYKPNRMAQSLKASHSHLIGCVVSDISSPFSALLLGGIAKICEEAGYQMLCADSEDSPKKERQAIESFLQNRVDGLIINTCSENDEYLLKIQARGVPMVLADRELGESGRIDTVTTPNYRDAYKCVEFLLDCGYTQIAYYTEQMKGISPRVHRNAAYLDAVAALCGPGTEAHRYQINPQNLEECTGYIREFRERFPDERIALLCANGVVAQSALLAMKALGLKAGYEFGFCTFDDWDWLRLSTPEVTAVAMGTGEIGAQAAKLLIRRIVSSAEENEPVCIQLPTQLIVRGSTVRERE